MKCLIYFGMSSMKEGTSAQLSGRGELHGGARVTTLVTLRKCTLGNKREIKTLKFVSASTKGFKGGLAWIKPSKKDMAVTFSYFKRIFSTIFQTQKTQIIVTPCQTHHLRSNTVRFPCPRHHRRSLKKTHMKRVGPAGQSPLGLTN